MRGKIIVSRFWTSLFTLGNAKAITLFPFVLLSNHADRFNPVLLNHEAIHIRQALELLVIPFYLFYMLEFCVRLIQCRDFRAAYRSISFEQEAYTHEGDLAYLDQRRLWTSFRFLTA